MVQVEIARSSDLGKNDTTYIVNTHLGEILNYNDTVLCYDLVYLNANDLDIMDNQGKNMPEVVIVKKTFPKFKKRQ